MRIAHVTATFPPHYTGAGMVCYYSAVELARRGHDVAVFTAAYPPEACDYPAAISVHRLPILFRAGNAPVLPGLLGLRGFDLIHLHHPFIFGAEAVLAISLCRRIPYIITHHNDLIGEGLRRYAFDAYSRLSTPMVVRRARKIVVVSADHARFSRLSRNLDARGSDVVEIPNGVDIAAFRPMSDGAPMRNRCGIPEGARVLAFIGALDRAHHYRRVDLLLEALFRMNDPGLYLVIAGDGDWLMHYKRQAEARRISPRVIFLGRVSHRNLPHVYAAADIVVLPSQLQESFGLVVIEAMACGKPVIASDLPGVRTVVSEGEDGLLARPGDLHDLTEKICLLLDSPEMRRAMGEKGRAKVEARYAWPRVIDKLEAVYDSVLAERAGV